MIMETAFADEINLWKDCTEAWLRTQSVYQSLYSHSLPTVGIKMLFCIRKVDIWDSETMLSALWKYISMDPMTEKRLHTSSWLANQRSQVDDPEIN